MRKFLLICSFLTGIEFSYFWSLFIYSFSFLLSSILPRLMILFWVLISFLTFSCFVSFGGVGMCNKIFFSLLSNLVERLYDLFPFLLLFSLLLTCGMQSIKVNFLVNSAKPLNLSYISILVNLTIPKLLHITAIHVDEISVILNSVLSSFLWISLLLPILDFEFHFDVITLIY